MKKPIQYIIDHRNIIRQIDGPWDDFAISNGDNSLITENVLNKELYSFLMGIDVIDIWVRILQIVRLKNKTLDLNYRCDSADYKRYMEMTVKPLDGHNVSFQSTLIREVPRKKPATPNDFINEDMPFLHICSWCNNVSKDKKKWLELEGAISYLKIFDRDFIPRVSHGICPSCMSYLMKIS